MNAIVQVPIASILKSATEQKLSLCHVPVFDESPLSPFVFDANGEVVLDKHRNLQVSMLIEGTDTFVCFRTAAYSIDSRFQGCVDVSGRIHQNDPDSIWVDQYMDVFQLTEGLCVVEQSQDLPVQDGMIFKLTDAQRERINHVLADIEANTKQNLYI